MSIPGGDSPYYTNSTQLPVNATDDLFEALDKQNEIQGLYTGGTVFHAYLGESIDDYTVCRKLVQDIATNYKIPYFTISPTFAICESHGYLKGEQYTCPDCGEETEVYARIVGYYRPVQNWNPGKKEEFSERSVFDLTTTKNVEIKQETIPVEAYDNLDDRMGNGVEIENVEKEYIGKVI